MSILLRSPTANSGKAFDFRQTNSLTQHRIEHSSMKETSQLDSLTGNSQNFIISSGPVLPTLRIAMPRNNFEPQTSIISPPASSTNKLRGFGAAAIAATNDFQQTGDTSEIKLKPTLARSLQPLRRASCNIKDGKSVLNFSTLYVAKFIRRIKEVSSLMRFKEIGIS